MKHPNRTSEAFGFNLGQAVQLRCVTEADKTTVCGSCETCLLVKKLNPVRDWFSKAGDQSRRRFLLGLVRRLHSVNLLEYFVRLLSPLLCKDYTYARTRTNPSLESDRGTMSSDRALNTFELDKEITKTWYWFQSSNYWTKSNFVLSLFRECESHLLYLIGVQARTLLASQRKEEVPEDDYEASSIASSHYSHESEDHPELNLLRATSSYSRADTEHLLASSSSPEPAGSPTGSRSYSPVSVPATSQTPGNFNDDSGDEGFGDGESTTSSSLDPACSINPTSIQAHAGVARYKDFICALPVHLSKYILGFLDQVSLHNCVCVSKNWRALVEQVHSEFFVQQHLWEDVMLMQGSGAQGCNPVYAKDIDVAVPNLESDSFEAIRTEDDVIQTTFKSEVNFTTAYSGFSTRNIIMEERNVYCGAYNVMVLIDGADQSRVFHTDGNKLIALGFHDRKVRFISSETGREVGPVISGHAGSVRCVGINEEKGYVLSGSYDTSIRCWSLETGKCQKIFRGHRDTIMCLEICGEQFVSGAKDKLCKVWQVATGKCLHTFKHRQPVVAVTMSKDMCISGCDGGKVKVWDLKSGYLIKKLTGHHGPVTGIKFDRWHIITASKDGYALAWSSQGDHKRCLSALRHPKEVLCVEFMYLRVVTGCGDGKLRIWNMVNGDCLRIMRGNSRSDPITSLIAVGNRVVLNTCNNLLVLNFEPIEYDYTLETDKMPSLVQYSQYSDAPVRQHPYTYIRAQRMTKAGATNTKIIYHDGSQPEMTYYRQGATVIEQVPHSSKTLSKKSLERARSVQSATHSTRCESVADGDDGRESRRKEVHSACDGDGRSTRKSNLKETCNKSVSMSTTTRPQVPPTRPTTAKSRATSVKSGTQTMFSTVAGFQLGGRGDDDSDVIEEEESERQRRVSWAFERPSVPKTKELNLTETKSLLRSQIRARGEVIPPDFIYLTVNHIQASMRASEVNKNMEANRREVELQKMKQLGRPSSSPSRIDPRTRLPMEELGIDNFIDHQTMMGQPGPSDANSVAESKVSRYTGQSSKRTRPSDPGGPVVPTKATFVRDFNVTSLQPADKNFVSIHSANIKSSIPKGHVVRPHTASAIPTHGMATSTILAPPPRSKSAGYATSSRPCTAMTTSSSSVVGHAGGAVATVSTGRRKKYHGFSTSATEANVVPMLMYPKDINAKVEQLKAQRQERLTQVQVQNDGQQQVVGAVSEFTNPFRSSSGFKLHTHGHFEQEVININRNHKNNQKRLKDEQDKRQKQLWLTKVRTQMKRDKESGSTKPTKKIR